MMLKPVAGNRVITLFFLIKREEKRADLMMSRSDLRLKEIKTEIEQDVRRLTTIVHHRNGC